MKKLLPLLLLSATCLASCGESTVFGKYRFLLGKQGKYETRVSLELELKDQASAHDGYKNLSADIEMSGITDQSDSEEDESITSFIADLLDDSGVESEENNASKKGKISLDGYYKVLDLKDEKYGNKVSVGFNVPILEDILTELGIDPVKLISNFVVSYVNNKQFTMQFPVSLDDIQLQLAWQGIYFDYDPYLKEKVNTISDLIELALTTQLLSTIKYEVLTDYRPLPGEQDPDKRYGSHPVNTFDKDNNLTHSDVIEMNQKYCGLFSNTYVYSTADCSRDNVVGTVYLDDEDSSYYFYPMNDFDPESLETHNLYMKEDQGILSHDFSNPIETALNFASFQYKTAWGEDVKLYKINYVNGTTWDKFDWKSVYQEPFVFRDFHDIKVNLMKE